MGGSETTTVKTAPLSPEGEEWNSIYRAMMFQQLDEGGFDINPQEVTKYQDPAKAEQFKTRLSDYDKRIADLDTKIAAAPRPRDQGYRGMSVDQQQRQNLQSQRNTTERDLNNLQQTTFTKWDVKKREDVRVVDAIDRYGADSPETRAMRASVKQEAIDKQVSLKGIESDFLGNLKKFVSGDYSYTPEQAQQAEIYTAPIRDIVNRTSDELLTTAAGNADRLNIGLNSLLGEIDKTGFDILDALKAADVQVVKSGVTMVEALRNANKSSLERSRFQFDLLSQDIDKKAAQTSAVLGLPPGSMAEMVQKTKLKTDALKQLELEAAERDATGELGIAQLTEGGKQRITLSRVALAESQGGKREEVGKMRLGIEENLGTTKLSVATARANAMLGLEQQKQGLLQNMAFGDIPSRMGAATGGLGFASGQQAQQLAFGQQLASPIQQQLGVEQQRQFAETTTTVKKKPGFLDVFSGIVGMGAGIAGAAVSGGGLGGGGGGGGAGYLAPQSSFNFNPYAQSYGRPNLFSGT